MKIYISADMEGLTGAVTSEQLGPSGFEYSRFREIMTDEVLAAIEGAMEAGATEFLVSDSHGNGQNLLIEKLPDDVMVVRAWPRPLMMMEGIDDTFDGAIFIGYHTSTTNPRGVRAHTMSSANLTDIRINGQSVSEGFVSAAIAGHFGVPAILVTGDDAVVEETQGFLPDIEGAVVKWANSFHSAKSLTPKAGQALIKEKAKSAVSRISDFQPMRIEGPIEVEIQFKHYRPAEILSYLPNIERASAHAVRFIAQDMVEVSKFIEFVTTYRVDLQP